MSFNDLKISTKVMIGSAVPLIFMIILGVICWFSISSLLSSNHMVDHTHVVIEEAMQIEAAAVDMETGMRGFDDFCHIEIRYGKDFFINLN